LSINGLPSYLEKIPAAHLPRRHKILIELLKQIPTALEEKTPLSLRKIILREGEKLRAS
uniref:Uncharacterized protein n=1 Tax=Prolemur simus TaxID=1328070 RepID=A0A8C8YMT2_PROSS